MRKNARRRPGPQQDAKNRPNSQELVRKPEMIIPFTRSHSGSTPSERARREKPGPEEAEPNGDPAGATSERAGRYNPGRGPTPRLKIGESLVMIAAALRVLGPYVLMILAAVGVAWGIWLLLF